MRICSWLAAVAFSVALGGCSSTPSPEQPEQPRGWSEPAKTPAAAYAGLDARAVVGRIAAGDASLEAAEALRLHGPAGLAAVLDAHDRAVTAHAGADVADRLARAADVAARQRDVVRSRLYWQTDLDEAKRVAAKANKPILSLRMLGRLDQDLSCANSRFFRTTLYPNAEVAQRMQRDFVLHWSSERPVPVVTIDYGDGRVVRRTITGNSIHYVLDAEGRVVDAIPGLYGPKKFAVALDHGRALTQATALLAEPERQARLAAAHTADVNAARTDFVARAAAVGYRGDPFRPQPSPQPQQAVPALVAIPAAMGKSVVEMPIARAIALDLPASSEADVVPWGAIGAGLRGEVKLDEGARAVMRAKAPLDWRRGQPVPLDDAGFATLVDTFETHVAEDMVKNEYFFRAQIRQWLAAEPSMSLAALNERVYAELFLTPASDPWLGLVPPVIYTGIQGDGF
jgi:hypothetical protein